ncbi:hypothetical protein TWF703_000125 [Orbilia oligospora]|uniref:Mitochondrial division protein 1 n=1 Tax=Orbilia oligospora TaxID=2813651 RepID=A0A7C8JW90_ORBOL|nr:hypothetical protein TWF703_000125 [Orbilia oligospora]
MASKKNRGAYRATNLSANTSEEEFRSALLDQLTDEEKSELTLDCRLAPACTDPGTQIAIFKFKPLNPRPPSFLQTGHPSFLLQGRSILIDVDFFGLTQLYTTPREIKIDIVALSGLNSHAYGSWVGPEVGGTTPMWLQDFFSIDNDMKDCRVMTFGYNTKYNAKAKAWIEDYVKTFLTGLNKARGGHEEQRRPLVLIGHSFGGTIIEHAFVKASLGGEYANVYKSIAGIFLFGVPFRGIYLNDVISMLDDDWELASQGHELKDGVYGRYGDYVIVVSKNSTVLETPGFESMPADGDHSTIVKLKSAQDDTYTTVRSRLKIIIQEAEAAEAERQARANDIFGLHGDRPSLDKTDLEKVPYVHSAAFDSETDELDARCHPETRKELLKQIKDWAQDPGGKCIFWLNGVAGTGKSTISRTVAHLFNDDDDIQLGASFFFKRGESNRDNASKFWTTIAVQLTRNIPGLVLHVQNAIQKEPDIATKTLEKQFRALVFHPLEKLIEANSSSVTSGDSAKRTLVPLVFVIDALDECEGDGRIRQILDFLAEMQKLKLVRVHIRIFLTSRPELPIRLGFDKMSADTHDRMILQDVPPATIEHDISVFLKWEFSKIRYTFNITQRECSGDFELPLDWPGADDIKRLTKMAIPLFIYASTVCRFVGDKLNWDPQQRLATILKYGTTYTEGGEDSQLNRTYLPVLKQLESGQSETQIEKFAQEFRTIIGSIVVVVDPLPISTLADLLGITKEKVNSKVKFSPDNKKLVSASSVGTVGLWDVSTGQRIKFLNLKTNGFPIMAFSPDSKELVMSSGGGGLIAWDTATGQQIRDYEGDGRNISILLFSPDGKGLATVSDDTEASLWDVEAQQLMKTFKIGRRVTEISFCSEGKQLVALSSLHSGHYSLERWVELWDIPTGELVWSFSITSPPRIFTPPKANFSFDGGKLALIENGAVRIWNLATRRLEENLQRVGVPQVACYDFDRKQLVGAGNGELRFWNTEIGEKKRIIGQKAGRGKGCDIASSRDGKRVAVALSDGILQLWDVDTHVDEANAHSMKTTRGGDADITAVTLSPDGTKLLLRSRSTTVFWDTASEQPIKTFKGIINMVFSPNGKFMALATYHKVRLFDSSDVAQPKTTLSALNIKKRMFRRSVQTFRGGVYKRDGFSAVNFSPDSQRLALGTFFGKITVLDTVTGKLVKSFQGFDSNQCYWGPIIGFSDDGKQLILATGWRIMVWDIETKQKLQQFGLKPEGVSFYHRFRSVALSPDRKLLASASDLNLFQIWDMETGHLLETFPSEYSPRSLQFSSDNKRLETDRQIIFFSSSPLRIIPNPASSRILLRGGWVTQHGQNILWLPHSSQGGCSASNDRLLILGSRDGAVSFFEFNYLSTKAEDT